MTTPLLSDTGQTVARIIHNFYVLLVLRVVEMFKQETG